MKTGRVGVLLMAYGTPERVEDIEGYYTDIRRGRPPTEEQLADLVRRYDAIGGLSPLAERTRAQRDGLARSLGDDYVVELGLKHATPRIEDGAAALAAAGVERVVGLVLAPHYSALSVGGYHERAETALGSLANALTYVGVRSWHTEPELIALLASRWRHAAESFEDAELAEVETLVTAHSLPERVRAMGDPYENQLRETAESLAAAADIPEGRWRVAWQSAGRTPEPWLGPDILAVMHVLAAEGRRGVIVCPAGFTSDHLEVLYDVDIEAKRAAGEHGLRLVRTASLNDEPVFLQLLARVVREHAGAA